MSLISQRYAEAAYALGKEQNKTDVLLSDLNAFKEIFSDNRDLRGYLKNPQHSPADREKALRGIFAGRVDDLSLHLLLLLMKNDRLDLLAAVGEDVQKLSDEDDNVFNITITTAKPADPETIRTISETFRKRYHADRVRVTEQTDPSLIGGAVVTVGDKLYDGSVKGKLKALQTEITAG